MFRKLLVSTMAAAVVLGAAGCATTGVVDQGEVAEKPVRQSAPLGSRIKKANRAAPVEGATREDIERARVQQGAAQTGAYQRGN